MIEVIILAWNQCKEIEKIAILIIKFSSKIYKLTSYNKTIQNLIYDCK